MKYHSSLIWQGILYFSFCCLQRAVPCFFPLFNQREITLQKAVSVVIPQLDKIPSHPSSDLMSAVF